MRHNELPSLFDEKKDMDLYKKAPDKGLTSANSPVHRNMLKMTGMKNCFPDHFQNLFLVAAKGTVNELVVDGVTFINESCWQISYGWVNIKNDKLNRRETSYLLNTSCVMLTPKLK